MKQKQTAYTRLQKILSAITAVVLITPFLLQFQAVESQEIISEHKLAVIFIDQNMYSQGAEDGADLTGKIYRYAEDVQAALPDTKALILPVAPDESPQDMFAVLEKFYLEGYRRDDAVFFLQGAVFIGDLPVSLVDGVVPFASIFPLTDFADPAFLWDKQRQLFVRNSAQHVPKAEIWHGVIRGEAEQIAEYLDKNHTFHTARQNGETPYTDAVLYADFTEESERLSPQYAAQYERTQEYAEEKTYFRYNKNLLQRLQNELYASINLSADIEDDGWPASFDPNPFANDSLSQMPDIHTKSQIEKLLPEYLEVIQHYDSAAQERALAAGRWDESQIDTIPTLITAMDMVSREALKEVNTFFEQELQDFVQNDWQRDVRMVGTIIVSQFLDTDGVTNYLNGREISEVSTAEDCSLYRGSAINIGGIGPQQQWENSQLIVFNRLYDPNTAGKPSDVCDSYGDCCVQNQQNPEQCVPDRALDPVFSWGGNAVAQTGNTPTYRDCQNLNAITFDNERGDLSRIETRAVSSVVVHDHPRPQEIQNALEVLTAGHIPSDGVRSISFQAPTGNFQRIQFLNTFDFSFDQSPDAAPVWEQFLQYVLSKQEQIENTIMADNLLLFAQYVFLKTNPFSQVQREAVDSMPSAEFLQRFQQYRAEMEAVFRLKFGENLSAPQLWIAATRAEGEGDDTLAAAADQIFARYFSFTPIRVNGPEIGNVFDFWREEFSLRLPVDRGTDSALNFANDALRGVENGEQVFPFRAVPLPEQNFLINQAQQIDSDTLRAALEWQQLTLDEKHSKSIELFFDTTNTLLPRHRRAGFALAYFRADGADNSLFWGGADGAYDEQWNQIQRELLEAQNSFQSNQTTSDADDGDDQSEDEEEPEICGAVEGVDIWEWIPAITCWLQSIQDLGVTIKRICGLDAAEDFLGDIPHRDRRSGELVEPLSTAEPVAMTLTTEQTTLAPQMETTIKGEIIDEEGIRTAAGGKTATVTIEGPAEFLGVDTDPDAVGIQLFLLTGRFEIPLRATNTGAVTVRVDIPAMESQQVRFDVRADIQLSVRIQSPPVQENGVSLFPLTVLVSDQNQNVVSDFSGKVDIQVSDPTRAFLGSTEVVLENGVASFPVAVREGPIIVTASVPHLQPATLELDEERYGLDMQPTALLFTAIPEQISFHEEIPVQLQALFPSGKTTTEDVPTNVQVSLTEQSAEFATLEQDGDQWILTTGEQAGTIHLIAESPGLLPAAREIQVGAMLDIADWSALQPNALITQFFGTPTANPLQSNNLAQQMLLSGKTLLYTGLTERGVITQPRATVANDGGISIFENGITAVASNQQPLQIKVFDQPKFQTVAEFALEFPENGVLNTNIDQLNDSPGVFFENFDTTGLFQATADEEALQITFDDTVAMTIDTEMNIRVPDARFSLRVADDAEQGIILDILWEGQTVAGRVHLRGATMQIINAPFAQELVSGGILIPSLTTADELPLYAGATDAVATNRNGVAWEDNALTNLLIASGQSAGEALTHMANPLLINWGDPTVALAAPNTGSTGFDRTVGEELFFSPEANLSEVRTADIDGDGRQDILLRTTDGDIRFLQNTDDGTFREWGDIAHFERNIWEMATQQTADGFADILILDDKGQLQVLDNQEEVFALQTTPLNDQELEAMAVTDLDGDGYEDLVVQQKDGAVVLFYGANDGFSAAEPIRIGTVGGSVTEDRTSDLLISTPGVTTEQAQVRLADPRPGQGGQTSFITVPEQSAIGKTAEDVNGEIVQREDRIRFTILIPPQSQNIHVIDLIDPQLTLINNSLNCRGCSEETLFLPPSAEGQYFQFWDIPAEQEVRISYEMQVNAVPQVEFAFEHVNDEQYSDDGIVDINLLIPGAQADGVTTFLSTGTRSYREVFRPNGEAEQPDFLPDMTDSDGNGIPDEFERDEDGDGIPDIVTEILDGLAADEDEDGIPDYWDNWISGHHGVIEIPKEGSDLDQDLQTLDGVLGDALSYLQNSTCSGQGCVALPINYAFLVPGEINLSQALVNAATSTLQGGAQTTGQFQQIMNQFGGQQMGQQITMVQERVAGVLGELGSGVGVEGGQEPFVAPIFGLEPPQKYVCFGPSCVSKDSKSYFRFYISPTLTAGVGIAICTGLYEAGQCFATSLPISQFTDMCNEINEKLTNFYNDASAEASSASLGQIAFVVDSRNGPSSAGGTLQVTTDLGSIRWNTPVGNNAAPSSTPTWFHRWIKAQMDEFKNMFSVPQLTFIYPDLQNATFYNKEEFDAARADVKDDDTDDANEKEKPNTAEEKANTFTENLKKAQEQADSIEDIYRMLRSIPLLDIQERTIHIAVPNLSKERLEAFETDLEDWLVNAQNEYEEWQQFITNWECPSKNEEECSTARQAWDKMKGQVDIAYEGMVNSIERNIEILNEYANFHNIIAHYDQELAKFVNGIICYVDAIADLMGGWFQKNLRRVEAWMVFYKTIPLIKDQMKKLIESIKDPVDNCPTCTADPYTTGGSVFDLVMGNIPTPPVIEMPKLPDIVLDISEIKASLLIEVPRLQFYPEPIQFPQLPRLRLPRVPTVTIVLPEVPLLPEMPPLPILPEFPDVPIPDLPTIPPPPKLPDLFADLGSLLSVVEKMLYLYCLFVEQGLFVYEENNLKPIIETLTARPSNVFLDMDFLNLDLPDISVPSVDELRVRTQVNFSLEFDGIVEAVAAQAAEWNQLIFDEKVQLQQSLEDEFDFGSLLDYEDVLPEDIVIDPFDPRQTGGDDLPARDRRPSDPVDPLDLENGEPLSYELNKHLEYIRKTLAQQGVSTDVSTLAARYNIATPALPGFQSSDTAQYLQRLRTALVEREEFLNTRAETLIATADVNILFKEFVPRGIETVPGRTQIAASSDTFSPAPRRLAQLPPPPGAPAVVPDAEEDAVPDAISSGQLRREGIFIFDQELGKAQKVVEYSGWNGLVRGLTFADVDNDSDDDLLILTPDRLVLKTNMLQNDTDTFFTADPEVADFETQVPFFPAVKNVEVEGRPEYVEIQFLGNLNPQIIGAEIILKNTATGFIRPSETKTKYVEMLLPEYLTQGLETDRFFSGERTLDIAGAELSIAENEEIMFSELRVPSIEFPIEEGFWTVQMRWILEDGKRSTFSQAHLAATQASNDQSPPLFVGTKQKRIPVFTESTISAEGVFDLESGMSFAWDIDADGTVDAQGFEIPIGPYLAPGNRKIILQATDAGGNTLEVPLQLEIYVPDITLDPVALEQAVAQGEVIPHLEDMPFVLLRERFNAWKMIRTPTANEAGRYFTDAAGEYSIDDFNLSKDAIVKDHEGEIIARISADNGRVYLQQEGYRLAMAAGDGTHFTRTLILSDDGRVVANVAFVAEDTSDVFLTAEPITPENADRFPGVTTFDTNQNDTVVFSGLPGDAPSFPGGAALFDTSGQSVLAMISRQGDVRFLEDGMDIRLKAAVDPTDPVIFEIRRNGAPIFDVYVQTDFEDIALHHGEYWEERGSARDRVSLSESWESGAGSWEQDANGQWRTANSEWRTANSEPQIASREPRVAFSWFPTASAQDSLEPVERQIPFSDLNEDHRYVDEILELYDRNILQGYTDGTVRPDQQITRAEFVKIVLGATTCADCTKPTSFELERFFEPFPFPDVRFGEWYAFCVAKAKKMGMVQGYGNGLFEPVQNISRAEAVAILLRAANIPLETSVENETELRDVSEDAWYRDDIFTGVNMGLIPVREGGFMLPEQRITRGEFAFMASTLLQVADCRDTDSDGDGLPDFYEIANGLDENDASDANADTDGDGFENMVEYREGTNPRDGNDFPGSDTPPIDDDDDDDSDDDSTDDDGGDDQDDDGGGGGDGSDEDRCPELPGENQGCPVAPGGDGPVEDEGVHVYPGDPELCGFLDFIADIRIGDQVKAAIMNIQNTKIFSESETFEITSLSPQNE